MRRAQDAQARERSALSRARAIAQVAVMLGASACGASPHATSPSSAPPQASVDAQPTHAEPAAPTPSTASDDRLDDATCGELYLMEIGLGAAGKGERYPRRVRVREALVRRCEDGQVSASLGRACLALRRERAKKSSDGYGPAHPDIRVLDAQLGVCPPSDAPLPPLPPPTPAECEALHRRRDELMAAGKLENHPEMLAVHEELRACPVKGP